jgi:transcriptional regulator with XRE-family HTH domain
MLRVRRLVTKSVHTRNYRLFLDLLIKARKDVGMTQEELAKSLNRPQSFISKCENGERRLDVVELLEILQAVGLDPLKFIKKIVKSG